MSNPTSPPNKRAESSGNTGTHLLSALRARRTYLLIYQEYRKTTPKADFAELLDALIDDTQDTVANLSRILRLMGISPIQAGVNEKLLQQGLARRGMASKLNFLLAGSTRTLEWYEEMPLADDPEEIQALWQDLAAMETRHLASIRELLGAAELAAGGSGPASEEQAKLVKPRSRGIRQPDGRRSRWRVPANPTRRKPGKR